MWGKEKTAVALGPAKFLSRQRPKFSAVVSANLQSTNGGKVHDQRRNHTQGDDNSHDDKRLF